MFGKPNGCGVASSLAEHLADSCRDALFWAGAQPNHPTG